MSLGPGAGPGMTINLEAGGQGGYDVEEQLRQEREIEQEELRAVLEAEMNDDDLLSDEEEEVDDVDEEETSEVELHTTDEFKGQQAFDTGAYFSYEQLLSFYKERGDELERAKAKLLETQEQHHRDLRSKEHHIAQLDQQNTNAQLDLERLNDRIAVQNTQLKEYEKRDQHLQHTLEQAKLCQEEQTQNVASLQMQLQHLQQQLTESLSSDKMAAQKNEYEQALHEQAQSHDRKTQSLRDELSDLRRGLGKSELTQHNLEHELSEARNDVEKTRSEYRMLQERYSRLGDEHERFKRNTANPVPPQTDLNNTQSRPLNFDATQTPHTFGAVDDGSYLVYANHTAGAMDGTLQQTHAELRKELEKALTRNTEFQELGDKTARDQERLTQDVIYWKKQVEDVREEQSVTLRSNMTKMDELEHKYEQSSNREKTLKRQIDKIRDDCEISKKSHEEKIRAACDLLHADAIQKMKDRHESEVEGRLYESELAGQERLGQAHHMIAGLESELDEVKKTYVEVCHEKDVVSRELNALSASQQVEQGRVSTQTDITMETLQSMHRAQVDKLKQMKNTFMTHYERQKERSRRAFQDQIEKDRAKLKTYYLEQQSVRGGGSIISLPNSSNFHTKLT